MSDHANLQLLIEDFYSHEFAADDRGRMAGVLFDEPGRLAAMDYFDQRGSDLKLALGRNDLASAQPMVDELLERHGLVGALGQPELASLQHALLRVSIDVAAGMKARFEGDFNYQSRDRLLQPDHGEPKVASGRLARPIAILAPQSPMFTERAAEFRKSQERRHVWDGQTSMQARKTYELFAQHKGDRPLSHYVRQDAVDFRELLADLPKDYGRAAKYRGMAPRAVVESAAELDVPRLSPRTQQRHISALRVLMQDALQSKFVSENIFAGFTFPSLKRPQDQRSMWSSQELAQLLNTPVWRGCHSRDRRSKPGTMIIWDEKFWLPLMALFSGMRQEEICQLELADIRLERGIWVFDINARGKKQVKNASSVRLVPIHAQLLKFGLLAYRDEIQRLGKRRLFWQLQPGGADGRLGHNYTKWFTRYRRSVDLYREGLDFHSFRHSATTFMNEAGVPHAIIDRLTGHVTPGETSRYTKSFSIEQLRDAINQLSPKTDLTFLEPDRLASSAIL